jgi:hypothetical protein
MVLHQERAGGLLFYFEMPWLLQLPSCALIRQKGRVWDIWPATNACTSVCATFWHPWVCLHRCESPMSSPMLHVLRSCGPCRLCDMFGKEENVPPRTRFMRYAIRSPRYGGSHLCSFNGRCWASQQG